MIYLILFSNIRFIFFVRRERDYFREGFNNWVFMIIYNWGEEVEGRWFL